jgi:hypothetical protein
LKPDPARHLAAPSPQDAPARVEAEVTLSADRPWPGMRPYREQDAGFYFGRSAEVDDLLTRTERSLLTLLYARGGLGKTSLVRAGLAPRLIERGYLPVYLRPRGLLDGGRDPIAEAIRAVEAAARAGGLEATADFDAPSLWELFHRQAFDLWDATNRLVVPVLVFDQFEEIFQVIDDDPAAAPRVRALLEAIAELVENRLPQRLAGGEFPAGDAQRFDIAAKDYRVVLSFREDYLPQMRKLRAIVPSVIENHVRLEPLTGRQALQVVEGAGGDLIDRDAATLLVKSVGRPAGLLQRLLDADAGLAAGGEIVNIEVEPAILSVVCFHLNSERLQRGQSTIDVGLVKRKSAEDIFDDYYRVNIGEVDAAAREFVESRLVTPGGERVPYPMREVNAQGPVLVDAVNRLLEQGILRKEWFGGEQRLEISHDLLLRPIRQAVAKREAAAARRRFTRRAAMGVSSIAAIVGLLWYRSVLEVRNELEQRQNISEALLVAYVPHASRERMSKLIYEVGAAPNDVVGASKLQEIFDWTSEVSSATDPNTARLLRKAAIDYVQLKVQRQRYDAPNLPALLLGVQQAVVLSCRQGFLQADDQAVAWFANRQGVAVVCARDVATPN